MLDFFILAAEPSGDLLGSGLIESLLQINPSLKIGAVAGPRMRRFPIQSFFKMEDLQVMGFIDVLLAIFPLIKKFLSIRNKILELAPKTVVFIDYPGFHLRLEQSLRKKGFKGKLVHYVSPTVWAWGKKRVPKMENSLDLLLTIFPFEKFYYSPHFDVRYVGHPLVQIKSLHQYSPNIEGKILALFPGSREKELDQNFPIQLKIAQRLLALDPSLKIAISISHLDREKKLRSLCGIPALFIPPEKNYDLMQSAHLAIATSGTVTLELALHQTPTVVTYGIRPLDVWLAQKIFKINLPFYCIVNIIASKRVFPEFFGPQLTEEQLFISARSLLFDEETRQKCKSACSEIISSLGDKKANLEAARSLLVI